VSVRKKAIVFALALFLYKDQSKVATSLPLAEQVPIDGVPTGPRDYMWRPNEPGTLVWAEALDGGNPKTKVPYRDRILIKPVGIAAVELSMTEQRFNNLQWIRSTSHCS